MRLPLRVFTAAPLLRATHWVLAAVLLITPFKSTAGARAGLLIVAAALILVHALRRDRAPSLAAFPRGVVYAWFAWLVFLVLNASSAAQPVEALSIVKRDVLTPSLAALLFFLATRRTAHLLGWTLVLTAGLLGLALLAIREPFDPSTMLQDPAYGHVGRLATWLILVAPIVALLWHVPRAFRPLARPLMYIAVGSVFVAGWMSANRVLWLCLALMLLTGLAPRFLRANAPQRRGIARLAALLLVPLLAMLAHSMDYRVRTQAADGQGGLAFLLSDHRRPIWNAALELIAERPWAGHGWDEELVGARLAERLPNDPWLKTYVRQAHNMSLNAALQWGVPGALLQGLFYLVLFAAFLKPALHAREPLSAAAASAGMALVAGYVMRNMVDDFTTRHLALMFGAAGGMLLGLACRRAKPKATIR